MITEEAINAGAKALAERNGSSRWESFTGISEAVLSAALPFLPIALEGKALDWSNFDGPTINKDWAPDDQELIYTALNYVSDDYGDKDEHADKQIIELLLTAWRSALVSSPGKDGGHEVEAVVKAADDALVSAVHAVFDNGVFVKDELLAPAEVRERVAKAIRSVASQPASTALVERLTKALEPFANRADRYNDIPGISSIGDCVQLWQVSGNKGLEVDITVGDLRTARAALAASKEGEQ